MELHEIDLLVKQWLKHIKGNLINTPLSELGVSTKKDYRDLVTQVDRSVEEYLRENIQKHFPGSCIIGEESSDGTYELKSDMVWVIDPIDGTANFVKQNEDYCIMIAYFEKSIPLLAYIYNVHRDELTYAMKGKGVFINDVKLKAPKNNGLKDSLISTDIRKIVGTDLFRFLVENSFDFRYVGCSGLEAVKVATGCFGGYIIPLAGGPWDFAPFILISEELGLHLSTWDNQSLQIDKNSSFVICTKQVFEDIKDYLQKET